MKTLELFCGTKSFSKVAKARGHETFTVDHDKRFNPDWCGSVLDIRPEQLFEDIVWMSPPCTTFSLASGNKHWTKDRKPKTQEAIIGKLLLEKCKDIAEYYMLHDKIFFIENPNGRAVWFLPKLWLKRVWYCQYGDTRAKPTNIWTNLDITFKTCKNNNPNCDHIRAKRGAKTGTQGLKNATDRGVIPPALFEHIFDVIEHRNK
jgi:hypothetical protein